MDKNLIIILVLLLFSSVLSAQEIDAEEQKIPDILLKKVEEGDGATAFFIGSAFQNGEGNFAVDLKEAKKWFIKAAELNDVHGMFELALMLFFDKEFVTAHQWFEKAAQQGHGESYYRLGSYHVFGYDDRPMDCLAAYEMYEEAQKRGVDVAFNDHAWMLVTMPDKKCRNSEKAWRLISELESKTGRMELMPLSYVDTKAAVLASIAEYNEAIATQAYVIESYCGLAYAEYDDNEEWMRKSAKQNHPFCPEGVERLKTYMERKPWREQPHSALKNNNE